jgi:hypothetical protein
LFLGSTKLLFEAFWFVFAAVEIVRFLRSLLQLKFERSGATLCSRNHKSFNKRFPQIVDALGDLPAETVIDGEVVALGESERPDFHRLQPFTAEASGIHYFVIVCGTTGKLCDRILEGGA